MNLPPAYGRLVLGAWTVLVLTFLGAVLGGLVWALCLGVGGMLILMALLVLSWYPRESRAWIARLRPGHVPDDKNSPPA